MTEDLGQAVGEVAGSGTTRTARVPGRRTTRIGAWVLAALCVQFFALGSVEAYRDGVTVDEAFQLTSGVTALTRHQIRIAPEQPPLFPALAALPALAARPAIPPAAAWRAGDGDSYSSTFMDAQARTGRIRWIVFESRIVPVLEGVGIGLLCYILAASLFGAGAGLLAAGMWLTAPVALGLSHLDSRDVPLTLMVLATSYALLRYRRAPAWRLALLVGAMTGLTLLARPTGLVMVPVVVFVVLTTPRVASRPRWRDTAAALVTAWVTVWIGYRALAPFDRYRHVAGISAARGTPALARLITSIPWPREYAVGLREQARNASKIAPAYLFGHTWVGNRWWFWPGSVVLKVAATTIIAVVVGLACWIGLERRVLVDAVFVVAVPVVVLSAFIVFEGQDLGVRYLLPVLALLFVAAGPVVRVLRLGTAARVAAVVFVGAQVGWFWTSVPHSLAWTAPPFRPGYRFAADSNVDWGQDAYELQHWLRHHPGAAVYYFGGQPVAVPAVSGVVATSGLRSGWYAISVSLLTVYSAPYYLRLRPLLAYCPTETLGGTILVYRLATTPDVRWNVSHRPARACRGRYSHLAERRAG